MVTWRNIVADIVITNVADDDPCLAARRNEIQIVVIIIDDSIERIVCYVLIIVNDGVKPIMYNSDC